MTSVNVGANLVRKKLVFDNCVAAKGTNIEENKGINLSPSQCTKGSVERKTLLGKIRSMGTFQYNTNETYNNGDLIVSRRPNSKKLRNPEHYVPCFKCSNYYSKTTLYRHIRRCAPSNAIRKQNDIQVSGRRVANRVHWKANQIMRDNICPQLNPGTVSSIIRNDELIILYGNKLTCKYRQPHLRYHIRQTLRTLARLLIAIKEICSEVVDFKSIFEPRFYNIILQAVNKLAKFNPETNDYDIPSLATRIGTYIKKCASLLITEYIKLNEHDKKKLVKDFLKIHFEDYCAYINKTAIETQTRRKRNKPIDLPLNEDVKKLHDFLNKEISQLSAILCSKFSYIAWLRLSKILLTSIQIFNRKRAGEIERLLISDFNNRQSIDKHKQSDLYKSLNTVEKYLASRFLKIELRGKLGRSVPILISCEQEKLLELILSYREEAQVDEANIYVFGCPGAADRYLRACSALREFSVSCGAKYPENLRGTKLRKQIATLVQMLNLNESELAQLANFMGHDLQIHKDHYRLPSTAVQIGQLSKLFLMMEEGNLTKYKGQNLNEINVLKNSHEIENKILDEETESVADLETTQTHHCTKNPIVMITREDRAICSEYSRRNQLGISSKNTELLHFGTITPKKRVKRLAPVSPVGKIIRRWSTPEKIAARKNFQQNIIQNTLPSGLECAAVIRNDIALRNRTVNQLKAWINNQIKKKMSSQI